MGRKFGKYSKLLFKMVLLIQLYCYYNLEVDAVFHRQENLETCDECHHHNGTYFGKEIEEDLQRTKRPSRIIPVPYLSQVEGNITVTDKRFYGPASSCVEISKLGYTLNGYYLVKGKNQTKNVQVEVLGCQFKHPDGSKKAKEERIGFIDIEITKSVKRRSQEPFAIIGLEAVENVADRLKRPVRLIPWKRILEKRQNNTENESKKRFYGPASSCEELGILGYTLNGLYLVDCKDKSIKGKIEVIECRFKQPQGSKEAKEERIGFVNIEVKKTKAVQRRHLNALKETKLAVKREINRVKRPIRLLPKHILYGKKKDNTEENKAAERFYGVPKSCSELGKLGYTLNGYYLVNGTASSHHIEISLCKFQQPLASNESLKEESFVLIPKASKENELLPLDPGRNKSHPIMEKIIPVNQKDGNSSLLKSFERNPADNPTSTSKFVQSPFPKTQSPVKEINGHKMIKVNPKNGESYLLMNQHQKCIFGRRFNMFEAQLFQSNCNPGDKGQIWKWSGGNLFNDSGFITKSIIGKTQAGVRIFKVHLTTRETYDKLHDLNWRATDKDLLISSDWMCLSVDKNSDAPKAVLSMNYCSMGEKGQFWSFMAFI